MKKKIIEQGQLLTEEELLDETIKGSFPASDPPGHFSKSSVDRRMHSGNKLAFTRFKIAIQSLVDFVISREPR